MVGEAVPGVSSITWGILGQLGREQAIVVRARIGLGPCASAWNRPRIGRSGHKQRRKLPECRDLVPSDIAHRYLAEERVPKQLDCIM